MTERPAPATSKAGPDWSVGGAPPTAGLLRRARLTAFAFGWTARELAQRHRSVRALERRQAWRIRRIVAHAHRNVPFYRESMTRAGIDPGEIRTAADLRRLPVIERNELQADPEKFMDETARKDELVIFRTGGSTGRPVTVTHDVRDLIAKNSAAWRLQWALGKAGAPIFRRRIAVLHPPRSSGEKLAVATQQNNLLTSLDPRSVELRLSSADSSAALIAAINEFQPHVVAGYGSALEELFAHSVATGSEIRKPCAVSYGADQMSQGARLLLSEDLGIPVFSAYRAVESPLIGFECERHEGMHVNSDICPVRILSDDGIDLGSGEQGEVVISNLVCRTTVLLNYRLGDLAEWRPRPCSCGRVLPMLSLVAARKSVYFTDRSGRRFPSQMAERAFSGERAVLGYRLEQSGPHGLVGEAIPLPGADTERLEERIQANFKKLVGDDPALEVRFVDRLPRTKAGKVSRSKVSMPTVARG